MLECLCIRDLSLEFSLDTRFMGISPDLFLMSGSAPPVSINLTAV